MFFRWLHKSWKYFWGIILSLLLVVVLVGGTLLGILQLDITHEYLVGRITKQIEESYHAELSVRELDGFLPFHFNMHDVVITSTDTASTDTLASVKTITSELDVWGLLQNQVTITGFTMDHPRIWLSSDQKGRTRFLKRREGKVSQKDRTANGASWFSEVEILAPTMEIAGGEIYLRAVTKENQIGNLPQELALEDIKASFFVDWNERQRYLDIESFSAKTEGLNMDRVSFSGQVYNDQRYLEFNSFYINIDRSRFTINGEVEGVNIVQSDVTGQLLDARYNVWVRSDRLHPRDLRDLIPGLPNTGALFTLDLEAEGTTDSLDVSYASLGLGESLISLNGAFQNLEDKNSFSYDIFLDQVKLRKQDIVLVDNSLAAPQYQALENLSASGKAAGTLDSVDVDLQMQSSLGKLALKGRTKLAEPYRYSATLKAEQLDISPIVPDRVDTTALNFEANLEGEGITLGTAETKLSASLTNSIVNNIPVEELELNTTLSDKIWKHEYNYLTGRQRVKGNGHVSFTDQAYSLAMQGSAKEVDLRTFVTNQSVASTSLNFDYDIEIQDLGLDRLYGKANLDVRPSIIGRDSVRAHQFYVDLNDVGQQGRSLRLTSSLLDMNVTGDIIPKDIVKLGRYWIPHLRKKFSQEILMEEDSTIQVSPQREVPQSMVLNGDVAFKDLSLIKEYVPKFPKIHTDSELSFDLNTDGTRLLFSAQLESDTLQYNKFAMADTRTQLTASFRSDRSLKEFSTVDLKSDIGKLNTPSVDMDSLGVNLAMQQDSIYYNQHVGSISDNARFRMEMNASLSDSTIAVSIPDFFMGNNEYAWTNEKVPSLQYQRDGKVAFNTFSFQNRNEYFRLQGVLSKNRADSLTYVLRDINLNRISSLIKGKVDFAGVLNGTLVTRSLTQRPTIQGALAIETFKLNDRLIGDVSFDSKYKPEKKQFDTQIDIVTDSTKYADYLANNDGVGQDIHLDGYFVTPKPNEIKQDTVFYFDADFGQVDMWVIPLIVNNVFKSMEGQATGEGYITGNLSDFDFHADFDATNVFAKPRFVNTNYFVNGKVALDRDRGVYLDSLDIMDTKGGTGVVSGTIDLNDFKPITYLDLSLTMDELKFLNNTMDPDVPFFGSVSGTGGVRLTGSNNDLYMRTTGPVQLTEDSEVSIPLLEETEFDENSKFIRFVDSFEDTTKQKNKADPLVQEQMNEEQLEEAIENMTFSERFDLDLQFEGNDNITVNLLFDPVLGEVLTAQGTGQMRISMQDQDVQMFGRYSINSGEYQFVTGEIISRRLELEPGGTIVWEGPPDNARLDISAIYRARPHVATLTSETTLESQDQSNGQRVPVELILEINGTLNSVENNYFFRLPSSIDLSSNSTLQYTINQINRDEEQKLFQATSILLSGQFIPTEGAGSATASLSQNLTRGSTVLNPLISNQVISPLLSNQINALLNSDVSRLDVDFNLNAYNEVDLGIALRLYNDRLILRREGQITGGSSQQSLSDRIGDINATYRIHRGLSLTAFHRQDQVLNSLSTSEAQTGDVTPSVDGIGLESQIQFNSWKELVGRIKNFFNRLFGGKKKENKEKSSSETKLNTQKATEQK